MRILFVVPYVPSPIRVRPYNFLRCLAAHNEITLLTVSSPREAAFLDDLRLFCSRVEAVPLTRTGSLSGCAKAVARGDPLQAGYCWSSRFGEELRSQLDRDFDLVHVEHLRASHAADLIPDHLPAVYDSVDCISLLLERTLSSSHSRLQRFISLIELSRCRRYEAHLLRSFDSTIVTSPEDSMALRKLEPSSNVAVIRNGVDLDYFRPVDVEREPATLVFSGKMSYHANVTALLSFVRDIWPLIREVRPNVRLRVVGSNPPRVVRALGSDPAITVTGYLPDIREPLSRSTIAICPMTVKVGIQNKILEAMAMGLPVVTTSQGASGLEFEAGRDALVAGDPREFAHQVCQLLGDPGLQSDLGTSGRRYVEANHRWSVAARHLEAVYRAVVDHRSSPSAPGTGSISVAASEVSTL